MYAINHKDGIIVRAANAKEIYRKGNSFIFVAGHEDLTNSRFTGGDLVEIHNLVAEKKVSKFQDRNTAVRRTWAAIQSAYPPINEHETEVNAEQNEEQVNTEEVNDAAPPSTAKRGRKAGTGKFAGKRIYALKGNNPRRFGTKGFASYELIVGKPEGVDYDVYIKAGGRPQDLNWDINHKWAEVR